MNLSKSTKIAIIIFFFFIFVITIMTSSKNVIVKDNNNLFFKANLYTKISNKILFSIPKTKYNTYRKALNSTATKYSLNFINTNNVKIIYFLDEKNKTIKITNIPFKYLGQYKIKASTHKGILKLWSKKNRIYGYIQFPNWAKGKKEYLKKIKIYNNTIEFTRSAKSLKELRRIGATSYFEQNFKGQYYRDCKKIKGSFSNKNAKSSWEAHKY